MNDPLGNLTKHRSLQLVVTVGLLLLVYPLIPDGVAGDAMLAGVLLLLILSGVVSLAGNRGLIVAVSLLGLLILGGHLWFVLTDRDASGARAELVAAGAGIPFFLLVAWQSLRYAVRHAELTDDRLIAAASAYLLVGLAWSGVHALIHLADPSAFGFAGDETPDWGSFVYFSFVTLTTLGYGDVTPKTEPAQAAATLEAIFGVFFLGFLVARMLAMQPTTGPVEQPSPTATEAS